MTAGIPRKPFDHCKNWNNMSIFPSKFLYTTLTLVLPELRMFARQTGCVPLCRWTKPFRQGGWGRNGPRRPKLPSVFALAPLHASHRAAWWDTCCPSPCGPGGPWGRHRVTTTGTGAHCHGAWCGRRGYVQRRHTRHVTSMTSSPWILNAALTGGERALDGDSVTLPSHRGGRASALATTSSLLIR